MLRDGLIAARGQILWIVLLVGSSLWIIEADRPAPAAPSAEARP